MNSAHLQDNLFNSMHRYCLRYTRAEKEGFQEAGLPINVSDVQNILFYVHKSEYIFYLTKPAT